MLNMFRNYNAVDFQNAESAKNSIEFLKEFCGYEKDPAENIGNVMRFSDWLMSEASQMGWEVKDVSVKDLKGNTIYQYQFIYEQKIEIIRDGLFSKREVRIEESKASQKLRSLVNNALDKLYMAL